MKSEVCNTLKISDRVGFRENNCYIIKHDSLNVSILDFLGIDTKILFKPVQPFRRNLVIYTCIENLYIYKENLKLNILFLKSSYIRQIYYNLKYQYRPNINMLLKA